MNFYKRKAFTLVELLVSITIIIIIIFGTINIDYSRLNQKQKLDIFINNIKTNFEITRNNSLAGKGIGINLNTPERWQIEYSKANSGTIITTSYSGSIILSTLPLQFKPNTSISQIRCLQLNGTEDNVLLNTETGSIEFIGKDIILKGDCIANTSKILELSIKSKTNTGVLQINTINGLVQLK